MNEYNKDNIKKNNRNYDETNITDFMVENSEQDYLGQEQPQQSYENYQTLMFGLIVITTTTTTNNKIYPSATQTSVISFAISARRTASTSEIETKNIFYLI